MVWYFGNSLPMVGYGSTSCCINQSCSIDLNAGHSPYPDLHLGHSYDTIISYLKEGNRMVQPESCSDEL